MSDLIVSRSDGRIVAQVSLDVRGDNMTVNTFSRDKPLAGNLSRHGGLQAQ
jgi:hypothetical protein